MQTEVDIRGLAREPEPPRTGEQFGRRRHVLARYALPAVLVAGFLAVLGWAARDALLPGRAVRVVPVEVSRAAVQESGTPLFKAAGWVEPRPTPIRVAALEPGVIERLDVVEDQEVSAGEPIAKLIDRDAELALESARAEHELREAELEEARAAVEAARVRLEKPLHLEAALAEAEADLAAQRTLLAGLPLERRRAEARLRLAEETLEGKTQAGGAVSGRSLQEAQSERDAAAALVEELRVREGSLDGQIEALGRREAALREQLDRKTDEKRLVAEAEARLRAAGARVEQARVAVDEAQLRLQRMVVQSPVAGRVLRVVAQPGARLSLGRGEMGGQDASTVVTLYQPDRLQVRVDVRFEDLPQVVRGQPVLVESPAVGKPLAGEVLFLGSQADVQKNTLEVKVAIDRPPEVIKPEMLVDVTFLAPERPESGEPPTERLHVYVPKQLVRQGEEGPYVWVADQAAGVARRTAVVTGSRGDREQIEVTEGLNPSSRLIANPPEDLRDGERINVTGEE